MKIIYPSNVDLLELNAHIDAYNKVLKCQGKKYVIREQTCLFLMHVIIRVACKKEDYDGWASLTSSILSKKCDRHSEYMQCLDTWGYVEINGSYEVGVRSKQYRIADSYSFVELASKKLVNDGSGLKSKIAATRRERRRIAEKKSPHLTKWLDRKYLQIDESILKKKIKERCAEADEKCLADLGLFDREVAQLRSYPTLYIGKSPALSKALEVNGVAVEAIKGGKVYLSNEEEISMADLTGYAISVNSKLLKKRIETVKCAIRLKYKDSKDATRKRAFALRTEIQGEEHRCSRDTKDGRFHSLLTNTPKEYLKSLSFNGNERLVNLDIKASQPTFFLSLLKFLSFQRFPLSVSFSTSTDYPSNLSHSSSSQSSPPPIHHNQFPYICSGIGVEVDKIADIYDSYIGGIEQEIEDYEQKLLSGKLYSSFADVLINRGVIVEEKGGKFSYWEKEKVYKKDAKSGERKVEYFSYRAIGDDKAKIAKYKLLEVFYSSDSKSDIAKSLEEMYPNIAIFINNFKSSFKDKNAFSLLLQNVESHFLLDVALKNIGDRNPKMPLYTVHDSVSTTEENFSVLRRELIEELTSLLGFTPETTQENWFDSPAGNDDLETAKQVPLTTNLVKLKNKNNFIGA